MDRLKKQEYMKLLLEMHDRIYPSIWNIEHTTDKIDLVTYRGLEMLLLTDEDKKYLEDII